MNKGIELILSRMESNPEEFQGFVPSPMGNTARSSRWQPFLTFVHKNEGGVFLPAEQEAVITKLRSIQGETFTNAVLQELLK
jgi:hypothetical protein